MGSHLVRPAIERFEAFFEKVDGCWLWHGTLSEKGYGIFCNAKGVKPAHIRAHRQAWIFYVGPIPEGYLVLHNCDTPPCVNPGHLFLGDHDDNAKDRNAKSRQAMGERQGLAKLTSDIVIEIRCSPLPDEIAALHFGIARRTVDQIRKRETWRHVP